MSLEEPSSMPRLWFWACILPRGEDEKRCFDIDTIIFWKITHETHLADTIEHTRLFRHVHNYIEDGLFDYSWQTCVAKEMNMPSLVRIKVFFRYFRRDTIKQGNLNSYAKYFKQKNCLVIDWFFVIDDYEMLGKDQMLAKLTSDIELAFVAIFDKYSSRVHDFNFLTFKGFFIQRMADIRNQKVPCEEYNKLDDYS